ncbi:NAD(P)/FAD-dependent oxidoreductase [Bordetella sp. 2513F-2]
MHTLLRDTEQTDVLIIGASHAGVECATALRAAGHAGRVLLLDGEAHTPYQRPPLSKAMLAGATDAERLALLSADACARQQIEYAGGHEVQHLDAAARIVRTQAGTQIRFERCVIATGARARTLPGLQGPDVFLIRNLADALALRERLAQAPRLLVVGGGYLGLEAASTAAKLGAHVTVIEQSASLMAGKVSPESSARLEALHAQAGIRILRSTAVAGWEHAGGQWHVRLADGGSMTADALLVSVGAVPNVELAEQAGLRCANGIQVDAACRSSAPGIYAIGDCASRARPESGQWCRIESVQNALEQARIAAADIAGAQLPAPRVPTFWSEQQGRRLQMAGLLDPALPVDDVATDTAKGWLVERYQAGRLAVVESVDSPVEFMRATKRIGAPRDVPSESLAT